MVPPKEDATAVSPPRLLKGAALVFATLGLGMTAWGVDKWIEVPGARATQFGVQAPLWPAFTLFVLLATGILVWLLWTAAGRVEEGEDLFAQRHRQRPADPKSQNENGRA